MRTRTSMVSSSHSFPGELFLQPLRDAGWDQVVDRAAEGGELLDPAGAEETVLRARHQVERVDVRRLAPVELVHLELVLEIGDRAQALHDRARAHLAREVDDERVERL